MMKYGEPFLGQEDKAIDHHLFQHHHNPT